MVECYVFICGSSLLVCFVVVEVQVFSGKLVFFFDGGISVWVVVGLLMEDGESLLVLLCIDCYCCFYEGIDNLCEVMQGYLDWEFGLVE